MNTGTVYTNTSTREYVGGGGANKDNETMVTFRDE
jgi:hypothetical protein